MKKAHKEEAGQEEARQEEARQRKARQEEAMPEERQSEARQDEAREEEYQHMTEPQHLHMATLIKAIKAVLGYTPVKWSEGQDDLIVWARS
jgi:hypothetical protein